jgi:hypothetical protein
VRKIRFAWIKLVRISRPEWIKLVGISSLQVDQAGENCWIMLVRNDVPDTSRKPPFTYLDAS